MVYGIGIFRVSCDQHQSEFSNLFLTSSTSPNSHRFDVQKSFFGPQEIHRIFTGKSIDIYRESDESE